MKIYAKTDRIILREIVMDDAEAMFEMDSDPAVQRYLHKAPIRTRDQAIDNIKFIRQQYIDYGIGRWAIVDLKTNQFVGWGGLKFRTDEVNGHTNFHDVGYRLLKRFWGQGFATESAKATLKYAFEKLSLDAVYALADIENKASVNALLKSGLRITARIEHEGICCEWFEISAEEWNNRKIF